MVIKSLGFPGTWILILALPLTGDVTPLLWALVFSSLQWAQWQYLTSEGSIRQHAKALSTWYTHGKNQP